MLALFLAALESDEDRRRFSALYERYHGKMERIAIGILRDQRDAEDAVQNAFLQIIRHFEKISEISCEELPFWIISIVKNEALMLLRKRRNILPLEDWEGFEPPVAAGNLPGGIGNEAVDRLHRSGNCGASGYLGNCGQFPG